MNWGKQKKLFDEAKKVSSPKPTIQRTEANEDKSIRLFKEQPRITNKTNTKTHKNRRKTNSVQFIEKTYLRYYSQER